MPASRAGARPEATLKFSSIDCQSSHGQVGFVSNGEDHQGGGGMKCDKNSTSSRMPLT